jgi:hypothetical protein
MEGKGILSKFGPPGGSHFIGKKCLKFLEPGILVQNTVSIVPIIGEYKVLSEINMDETGRNIRYTELF